MASARSGRPRLPHPIPYQGSKRNLAPMIGAHVPRAIDTWYEPFAGSAAMTIWAAANGVARRYVVGDLLAAIAGLWRAIVRDPDGAADRYEDVWAGQTPEDADYFNRVRDRYNSGGDPIDLLYLICRCVKNSVRFNGCREFTQSVDKRRLGMRPARMREAMRGASSLLKNRVEIVAGDWLYTLRDAGERDFVYMDPPYSGASIGRDKRYAEQMTRDRLTGGLRALRARNVRFALSYDGMTGNRDYGPPLPDDLGLARLLLRAGLSSQATLNGRREETVESLYFSPGAGQIRLERDFDNMDIQDGGAIHGAVLKIMRAPAGAL